MDAPGWRAGHLKPSFSFAGTRNRKHVSPLRRPSATVDTRVDTQKPKGYVIHITESIFKSYTFQSETDFYPRQICVKKKLLFNFYLKYIHDKVYLNFERFVSVKKKKKCYFTNLSKKTEIDDDRHARCILPEPGEGMAAAHRCYR